MGRHVKINPRGDRQEPSSVITELISDPVELCCCRWERAQPGQDWFCQLLAVERCWENNGGV